MNIYLYIYNHSFVLFLLFVWVWFGYFFFFGMVFFGCFLKYRNHQTMHPFATFKKKALGRLPWNAVGKWLNAIPK